MKIISKALIGLNTTGALLTAALLLSGCASAPSNKQAAAPKSDLPAGVTLHEDKDIQGVWLADGFTFKGYDALYIDETVFKAIERPQEAQIRTIAMRVLRDELRTDIGDTKLFPTVATRLEDLKPQCKALKMSNAIIEYEKGGGGARFWAGLFGAGQPVIKVRGEVREGDKLVCVYELRRSGESVGARMSGVWMSDEEIQRNDIRDLAHDFADFLMRTAK